jgi:tetratricopeptide (TPR) repeat protein
MTHLNFRDPVRSRKPFSIRVALATFVFAGAQCVAPSFGSQFIARAQSSSKPSAPSKTQRLANPLNDLLDEAQRDIDKNNFEAAVAPLQKVTADQPEFAYAHFQLAYVYTALKKMDEARAEYERTIALDPKMGEAFLNLGLLFLQSNPPGSEPAFDRAVPPLRKAVELMPGQKQPLYELAVAQERSGDAAGAEESFEALLRLDPDDLTANTFVGGEFLRKNRPQEAEARFRHALEHYPGFHPALLGLARSLEEQKKTAEAVDVYRQSLARVPNRDIRVRIVRLLMEQEQYDAALAELDRVPKFQLGNPDDPIPPLESLKLRADIQIAQRKWQDAIATLRQAVTLAPNDAQLRGGLGRTYLQVRDFPNAEKELKTAIRLDGKNVDYWKDLSSTYYLSKNYAATLAVLGRIDELETPGAGSWFLRALCYDNLRQPKPALEAYQKFLELDQNKNPDQVWQAQERSKVLRRMLEGKK